MITHSDTHKFKPHPSAFTLALKKLSVLPDAVLFVGDNPTRDIKGAKAVGMRTCLAKYGQMFKSNDIADYEIEKFEELLGLI
ncbi:HAD family hydrolase [Candidatus Micrarchaeota archaeon]|nr:HAD family hydrolase [Candidatus Micrarchaeota archaeon]